jgi:hypothetical protein
MVQAIRGFKSHRYRVETNPPNAFIPLASGVLSCRPERVDGFGRVSCVRAHGAATDAVSDLDGALIIGRALEDPRLFTDRLDRLRQTPASRAH